MKKVIIAHRWSGSPNSDWYPWLKKELQGRGYEVIVPEMGDTEEPTIAEWTENLKKVVGKPDKDTIIVGHSIGAQTALRYLENLEQGKKIAGLVSVAGWFHLENLEDEETEEIARPWLETPIDFEKARSHINKIHAIFSDNDPYEVSVEIDGKIFEDKLGAKIETIKAGGHFTEDDGYLEFPQVLEIILKLGTST